MPTLKHSCLLAFCAARGLFGWGCEGHQTVALIAEKNLTPHALAQVRELLSANSIDPKLVRYCVEGRDDVMADASTWPDDIRRFNGTGKWHYMDIPRQYTSGDPGRWCEPVGPALQGRGDRAGCVLSAIQSERGVLANMQAPAADRADALRYLIHFVGDIHQPLHVTDNKDDGGNCAPVVLANSVAISNLHSIWDSGLIEEHLRDVHETPAQYAAGLNQRFAAEKNGWAPPTADVPAWIWEGHALANETTFGALQPQIPVQPDSGKTDCNAESEKVYLLHIHLGKEYMERAMPVIDQQLAKAGFRLAAMLNEIWP